MSPSPAPFDVCGELPTGTTLLEASAGTGKTFTIAALATRIVAEGRAELSELMLVTFGRAATAELRDRVRQHLLSAYRKLSDPVKTRDDKEDDVARLLATGSELDVGVRRQRLRIALSAFDAATIATTHGFCQQMLAGLGSVGDSDAHETLTERVDDIVDEALTDEWVRRFGGRDAPTPTIGFGCARTIARSAVGDRHARPIPDDAPNGSDAQLRHEIAAAVRAEVQERKRARHLYDYDDQLSRLRDALTHPITGEIACQRLRDRYRYVLVDEFQDTDPVQWEILRTAFHGHTTLILIGDPKQAIYAFRGADVYAYLAAVDVADTQRDLARNWRSDADLLRALYGVYGGIALGDPRIIAREVAPQHTTRRLAGAPDPAPLRLRLVPRKHFDLTQNGLAPVDAVRSFVADDLAADVVKLLKSPATLILDDGPPRRVDPGDVAVLVGTHRQASTVHDALLDAGVPAVLTGMRSVFTSPAARDWLSLLRALEQPNRAGLVRSASLTSFVGWGATRLATADEDEVNELSRRMRDWRNVLADRGVAALLEVISGSEQLAERVLSQRRGERTLTDLRHVGQVLHEAMHTEGLGPTTLADWLQRRISDAETEVTEERSRRLETDTEAVQVVTIHTSKGLEFPLVYLPYGWDEWQPSAPETMQLHGPDGERLLFVGGRQAPGWTDARAKSVSEDAGENLRLLYVALTRAQCQVVTWWAGTRNTDKSALHRLLFGPKSDNAEPPPSVPVKLDVDIRKALQAWAASIGDCVSLEEADLPKATRWTPAREPAGELAVSEWDRTLDLLWRRTSYSSLTAAVHDGPATAGVVSEPETVERQDEPVVAPPDATSGPDEDELRAIPSPMAHLPSGTTFGTVVHSVLETLDTTAPDLGEELRVRCEEVLAGRLAPTMTAELLATGLLPVTKTPLGGLVRGQALADIKPKDRLTELDFELPLVGGDRPKAVVATLSAVAALLRKHLHDDDPLVAYADLLDTHGLRGQVLRGYLAGSIDAVLRVHDDGTPRYVVVDYKTNWLGQFGPDGALPLTAWDYRPSAMTTAMLHAHYPLQALLYAVALHRYLRWRQPGYQPSVHLGGILYLFVRGMCGPSTPVVDGAPTGVFQWQPPVELVQELSLLLDRGKL